jgi:hypothetical protein
MKYRLIPVLAFIAAFACAPLTASAQHSRKRPSKNAGPTYTLVFLSPDPHRGYWVWSCPSVSITKGVNDQIKGEVNYGRGWCGTGGDEIAKFSGKWSGANFSMTASDGLSLTGTESRDGIVRGSGGNLEEKTTRKFALLKTGSPLAESAKNHINHISQFYRNSQADMAEKELGDLAKELSITISESIHWDNPEPVLSDWRTRSKTNH